MAKESVDLLIIGLYKANSRRKGLALKGNALALAARCVKQHGMQACGEGGPGGGRRLHLVAAAVCCTALLDWRGRPLC